jgi:hypothetical protein
VASPDYAVVHWTRKVNRSVASEPQESTVFASRTHVPGPASFPRWVSLFFFQGTKLEDPEKLLEGGGKRVRHIVLEDAATLDRPAVKALMKQALERAPKPLDDKARSRVIIKSISAKQRPRRPA